MFTAYYSPNATLSENYDRNSTSGRELSTIGCGEDRVELYAELGKSIFSIEHQPHPLRAITLPRSSDPTNFASMASSTTARTLAKNNDIRQFGSIVGLSNHPTIRLLQLLQSRMINGAP